MNNPILFYDSECPLCVRFKQALEHTQFDIKIDYISLKEKAELSEFDFLNSDELHKEVHLLLSQNPLNVLKGEELIAFLAHHNERVKKFAWLLETDVGKKASEVFYHSVNRLRQSLRNHCPKCKKEAHL